MRPVRPLCQPRTPRERPGVCASSSALASSRRKHPDAGACPPTYSDNSKRDTPQQLSKYVPYFDPDFVGLTANQQPTIEAFARNMGVAVIIQQPKDPDGNYTVDHSAQIFVFDPSGKLTAVLSGPFTIDALRGDLRRISSATFSSSLPSLRIVLSTMP